MPHVGVASFHWEHAHEAARPADDGGEEAIVLALALRDADERLGDAVYHIAEDYHLASLEASQELE